MAEHIKEIAPIVPCHFAAYPNAGLPDEFGTYKETPEHFAQELKKLAEQGLLNIVGGCCGTCTEHIRQVNLCVSGLPPRKLPQMAQQRTLCLSGLDDFEVSLDSFTCIGERCNVAGSRTFRNLIAGGKYEDAVKIARDQIRAGAQILDISMDDALIDGKKAFRSFLKVCGEDPYVSRVPLVIDSSNIDVIKAALTCVQGKSIANSISLKEAEESFVRNAKLCKKYGASIVIMAVTFKRFFKNVCINNDSLFLKF